MKILITLFLTLSAAHAYAGELVNAKSRQSIIFSVQEEQVKITSGEGITYASLESLRMIFEKYHLAVYSNDDEYLFPMSAAIFSGGDCGDGPNVSLASVIEAPIGIAVDTVIFPYSVVKKISNHQIHNRDLATFNAMISSDSVIRVGPGKFSRFERFVINLPDDLKMMNSQPLPRE